MHAATQRLSSDVTILTTELKEQDHQLDEMRRRVAEVEAAVGGGGETLGMHRKDGNGGALRAGLGEGRAGRLDGVGREPPAGS